MKLTNFFVLTVSIAFLTTSSMMAKNDTVFLNATKKWTIALSNSTILGEFDNFQIELERKFKYTNVGVYLQGLMWSLDELPCDYDYLPEGGFSSANSRSLQVGFQFVMCLSHRPESKWSFWNKWRTGVSISRHHNITGGPYWHWNENHEKEYYMIEKNQSKTFCNFEASFNVGFSRRISNKFSLFFEPGVNFQFLTCDYRIGKNTFSINTFFPLRYGVSYSF
jgi:hypothetical protein